MIYGAPYWSDRDRFYIQENNPTEQLLRKRKEEESWLESCGPTAAVNCLASLGYDLTITCPGPYKPQPEEVLMDFFNDPRNYDVLEKIRVDVLDVHPGNRIPQFYPYAVKQVFGAVGTFAWVSAFKKIVQYLKRNYAVQLTLIDPGHYIAVVAYDDSTEEIIYNDPWPSSRSDDDGFNRRMDAETFQSNVKNYAIIYYGRKM